MTTVVGGGFAQVDPVGRVTSHSPTSYVWGSGFSELHPASASASSSSSSSSSASSPLTTHTATTHIHQLTHINSTHINSHISTTNNNSHISTGHHKSNQITTIACWSTKAMEATIMPLAPISGWNDCPTAMLKLSMNRPVTALLI